MKYVLLKYVLLCFFLLCTIRGSAQFYSLGTNLPILGTATINAEASMTLDRNWSLHLPVYYNPFVFSGNKRLQNFTVMPGVRYWLLESYVNAFVGANAIGSKYHLTWKNSRYEGQAYGAGISAGYAWLLSTRWNLEVEAGIGLVWTNYTEYECEECGRTKGQYTRRVTVPNKLSLSLIYLF